MEIGDWRSNEWVPRFYDLNVKGALNYKNVQLKFRHIFATETAPSPHLCNLFCIFKKKCWQAHRRSWQEGRHPQWTSGYLMSEQIIQGSHLLYLSQRETVKFTAFKNLKVPNRWLWLDRKSILFLIIMYAFIYIRKLVIVWVRT